MGIILARVGLVRVWGSNQAATGKMFSLLRGRCVSIGEEVNFAGDRDREGCLGPGGMRRW